MKIDWDEFDQYFHKEYIRIVPRLRSFLDPGGRYALGDSFYYNFFYISFSRLAIKRFIKGENIFSKTFTRKDFMLRRRTKVSFENDFKDKNISWKFFNRHKDYAMSSVGIIDEIEVSPIYVKRGVPEFKATYGIQKEIGIDLDNEIINRILFFQENIKNIFSIKPPKSILTSAHAVQNSIENLFYILLSKHLGAKIIILQPSFFHNICKYYDQDILERNISDVYLSWGAGSAKRCKDEYIIGSFYSSGKEGSGIKNIEGAILPQIPMHKNIRAQSKYYGLSHDIFQEGDSRNRLINNVHKLVEQSPNIEFRAKSCDYKYYLNLFKKINVNNNIVFGDINNHQYFDQYVKTHVMYFGTAIPESLYKGEGSEVMISFGREDVDLKDKISDEFWSSVDQRNGKIDDKFIKKYCIKVSPNDAAEKLEDILKR